MEEQTGVQTGEVTAIEVSLTEIQQEAYALAEKELDAYREELTTKKYLVDLKKEDIKTSIDFMNNDAQWKFTESLGIGEVTKDLETSLKKNGKIFISAVATEALYYYLSKVEGTGKKVNCSSIADVETYLRIVKAINLTRGTITKDVDKQKELEYILACRAEGVDPTIVDENSLKEN